MTDSPSESTETVIDFFKQWKIASVANAKQLVPKSRFEGPSDRNYWVKNKNVRKFLQHEEQSVGINLGWTDDAEPQTAKKVARWFFTRKSSDEKPIRYGETIALGNGKKPSFIRYKERSAGINLDWSDTPVFEWKLLGGSVGQPVGLTDWVAIYNEKGRECLIFFDRSAGADIGWPSSKTFLGTLEDRVREAIENHSRRAYDKLMGRK